MSDTRKNYEISEFELDEIYYDFAVTEHGHASVKSFLNDLNLWDYNPEETLTFYDS